MDPEFERGSYDVAVVPIDEFDAEIKRSIGNAGRFSMLLQLKSVSKMERAVLFCLSIGHSINETVEQIQKDVDESFDHKRFYKIRRSIQSNDEVAALLAA